MEPGVVQDEFELIDDQPSQINEEAERIMTASVASLEVDDLTASIAHVEVETEEYGSPEPSVELSIPAVDIHCTRVVRGTDHDTDDDIKTEDIISPLKTMNDDNDDEEEEISPEDIDETTTTLSMGSASPMGVWEDVEETTDTAAIVDPALRLFLKECGLEHLTSSALGRVSMSELESVDLGHEFEQLCDALSIVERIKLRSVLERRQGEIAEKQKMESSIRRDFENDRRRHVLSKTEVSDLASSVDDWRNRKRCKLMLLGDCSVGKTTLIARLVHDVFVSDSLTTVGIDFQTIHMRLTDGTLVEVEVWDTGGQERYCAMPKSYSRRMDSLLFVYDVCDLDSFENIGRWLREMGEASDLSTKVVYLIGSKKDKAGVHRVVPADRALEYADRINAMHYECSSKTGQGVIPLFVSAVTDSIAMKAAQNPDSVGSPPSRRASLSRARGGGNNIGGGGGSGAGSTGASAGGCCN